MKVVVLGAGLAGVSSAWYLAQAGHEVIVVDRQSRAGEETSFANGGQISVSHPEPWANPGAPWQVLRWLGREDAPLLFRFRMDAEQWKFALSFLAQCLPSRTRRNTEAIANLAVYSRSKLRELREKHEINYDARERGILHLFFNKGELSHAARKARTLKTYGIHLEPLSRYECQKVEPALASYPGNLDGGLYAPDDESGDAYKFVGELTRLCEASGVRFNFGSRIDKLESYERRIAGVHLRDEEGRRGRLNADVFVMALGSYSNDMMRSVGLRLPIYPVKGYSVTIPLAPGAVAPTVSITDESRRIVMSRLGERLRVAGTAELNGYDRNLTQSRCDAILKRAREIFPLAMADGEVEYWTGLRPATPSGVPLIGRSYYDNLYLNTGHGTLGWTLACGSGRALADIVDDRTPEVKFPFLLD